MAPGSCITVLGTIIPACSGSLRKIQSGFQEGIREEIMGDPISTPFPNSWGLISALARGGGHLDRLALPGRDKTRMP